MNVHLVVASARGVRHYRSEHTSPILRQHGTNPEDDAESGCVGSPEGCLRGNRMMSDRVVVPIRLFRCPLPSCMPSVGWWETPAVTSRPLNPVPEECRNARQFVRELLTCWGLSYLSDDRRADHRRAGRERGQARAPGGPRRSAGLVPPLRAAAVPAPPGGRGDAGAVTDPSDDVPKPKAPSDSGENAAACRSSGRSAMSGAGPRSRAAARPSGPC